MSARIASFILDLHRNEILNSNQRLHHHERARRTAAIRNKAVMARLANREPVLERAHCLAAIVFPDRRRRDAGNWYPSAKAAVDGICAGPAGLRDRWSHALLPDDDSTHLDGPDLRIGWDGNLRAGWVRLSLTFTELETL